MPGQSIQLEGLRKLNVEESSPANPVQASSVEVWQLAPAVRTQHPSKALAFDSLFSSSSRISLSPRMHGGLANHQWPPHTTGQNVVYQLKPVQQLTGQAPMPLQMLS
jgi:hypothetical protein